MSNRDHRVPAMLLVAALGLGPGLVTLASAGAREEGRLLVATEVLEEVEAMPDQRIPDALLSRAYGLAVIPDVTKVAFNFGGRHGNGVLVVRDTLTSPWSNPVFVSLTGGSWGFQAGAQSSDIVLVFTTKAGIEGITGGKITLGADASVATETSAPSVILPPEIPSIPARVVNTRIISEDWAPAWNPQLPPVNDTNTGLLHGEVRVSRTTSTPLP